MRTRPRDFLWILPCLIALLAVPGPLSAADEEDKSDEYYELMKKFADTFEQIDRNYVKDVDRSDLVEAAISGMLQELDQYSSYIKPEDMARFNQQVEQKFGGIGIQVQIDPETNRLTVVSPLPGTPAYEAGVRAGDTIMEIEGKSTKGYTLQKAVKLLKGKVGEEVTIGVRHVGDDEIEQIRIERDIIEVPTVLGDRYREDGTWDYMIDDEHKIAYIRLSHFSRRTAAELQEALKNLRKQGIQGLILDLRFNPGGLLSQAVEVCDMFVESGKIVSTKGRNTEERTWTAKKSGTFSGFPMAVLVNRYSASASEIVSACLQDHDRAVVIGERTWGKGSVQNVIELEEGSSALKLTTASYHRPSGKNIHRFPGADESDVWGVKPNDGYSVEMSPQELRDYLRYRRNRDVLSTNGPPESDFEDVQREKALDYLHQQLGVKPAGDEAKADTPAKAEKPKASGAALKTPGPQKLSRTQAA